MKREKKIKTEKKSQNNKDKMLLVISIIFSIFLWSYVRSEVDPEVSISIKGVEVRFENIAEIKANNLEVISPQTASVDVRITGKRSNISKVNRDSVSASVNLSGYYSGDYKIPVKVQVNGSNLVVEDKSPEVLDFKIDEVISKNLDADIITSGTLVKGYVLGNVKQTEEVQVKGARTYIDKIKEINAIFDVNNKMESTVITSKVKAYDADGNEIEDLSFTPESIDLDVPILKTQTLPIKLNIVGDIPEGMDIKDFSVEPNSVTIKGNSAVLNKIEEISTSPIPVNSLIKGQIPVDVILPDGVSLVDKDIKFVASSQPITILKQKITLDTSDIKVKNVPENYKFTFSENTEIELVVTPKDPISNEFMSKSDVRASMDITGLEKGKHDVKLNIKVPDRFRILSMEPTYIEIQLDEKGLLD
ncbi:CdaR family protein [Peptoniphilus catoniae]|uniref:CdaR family protein n=1 Tax=Peptoniphilus catoniae TaxID=1660341 RepID=UPI0010FEBBC1|nr:CdaR family protein [Peptoniphilus catoniae]